MAAPRNTYRNYPLVNDGEESLVGVPTANKVTLLNRFYLDDILVIQKQDEVTNATEYGIIGMVENGSQNYHMHNASRFFVLRGYENHIMLNDAGFNTLGKPIGDATPINLEFVNVLLSQTYKSAYWVNSDICGFEFRMWDEASNSWGGWGDASGSSLPRNTEQDVVNNLYFTEISETLRTKGFQVRPYLQNAEGKMYGEVSLPIFVTGVKTILDVYSWGGTKQTYYRDTLDYIPASQGQFEPTRFFTDKEMTLLYEPEGIVKFYYAEDLWIEYGYSQLFDTYAILTKGEDTIDIPTEPPAPFEFKGFDVNSQVVAEEQVIFNVGSNMGTIYLEETSGIAYKSYSGSYPNWVYGAKADKGFYADGNMAFVSKVYYVGSDGYFQEFDPINQ